jgi:FkbM family methyltransferase
VRLAGTVLRRYPSQKGRTRLSSLLLEGSLGGDFPRNPARIASALPEGSVLGCRRGISIRIHRDPAFIRVFLYGEYEEPSARVFSRLVRPGDTVIDAGANFGWYTALFATLVGPRGAVHAFEPVAAIAALAADTIRINGIASTACVRVEGLGSERGEFTVHTFAGLPLGHASASDLGRPDANPVVCSITTLDAYAAEAGLEEVSFLKADVEGHERDVFVGARGVLNRDQPLVAFEINAECLGPRGLAPADVLEALLSCGYTHVWAISAVGPRPVGQLAISADYIAAGPRRRGDLPEPATELSELLARLGR